MMRIEAARRVFPRRWFNETELKLDAMRSATTMSVKTRSAMSVYRVPMPGSVLLGGLDEPLDLPFGQIFPTAFANCYIY